MSPKKYLIVTNSEEININEWKDFVFNHPWGSIFQTPDFFNSYKDIEKNNSLIVSVIDSVLNKIVGLIVAVIHKEGKGIYGSLTSRSIIMGQPLALNNDENILNLLISEYDKVAKKNAIYSQFRNLIDVSKYRKIYEQNAYEYEDHLNILIDLTKPVDTLWKEVHSKRRNEIRKADKTGIKVEEVLGENSFIEAYKILKEVYSNAGLPLIDFDTLKKVFENFEDQKYFRMFAAKFEDEIVGIMLVLCYKDKVYDWFAGSYRKYYNKCPNDALPWYLFKFVKEEGFKIFDFGGAGKPNVPYGVRDYKKKFGGELVNFGRYQKIHKPILYQLGKIGLKIYKKLR